MNRIAPEGPIDLARLKALIAEHDTQALAEHPSDPQQQAVRTFREYVGDKVVVVIRTAARAGVNSRRRWLLFAARCSGTVGAMEHSW